MWEQESDRMVKVAGEWVRGSAIVRIRTDRTSSGADRTLVELVNGSQIATGQSMNTVLGMLWRNHE